MQAESPEISSSGPLAGIRVIDAAEFVTGPFAAAMMASLGADVIKVERPPKGDGFRSFGLTHGGMSACWATVNHGKRSVLIDLKDERGREAFLELIAGADVLIQNWRPKVADQLRLGDEVLSSTNPRLIRLGISGYGITGPLSSLPAFDSLIQARTGMMRPNLSDAPTSLLGYPVDKATALYATQAVLAALVGRARTGEGARIDLSMMDVAAHYSLVDVLQDRVFPESAVRTTGANSTIVATADGFIVVSPVTGKQISRTLDTLGLADQKDYLKAADDHEEFLRRFYSLVEDAARTESTDQLMARFEQNDVPAAPVVDGDAFVVNDEASDARLFEVVSDSRVGRLRRPRYPALFNGQEMSYSLLPPSLPDQVTEDKGMTSWHEGEPVQANRSGETARS